jgi:hypothetical protein
MDVTTQQPDQTGTSRPRRRRPRRRLVVVLGGAIAALVVVVVLAWFQPQALLFDREVDDQFPTATSTATAPGPAVGEQDDPSAEADGSAAPAAPSGDGASDAVASSAEDGAAAPPTEDGADAVAPAGDGANSDRQPEEAAPTEIDPVALGSGSFSSRNRYTVTGQATVYRLQDGSRTLRLEDFQSTNGPDLFVYLTVADESDTDPQLDADAVDLGVLRGNVGNQNYAIPAEVDLDRYDTVVIWCRRFTTSFGAADLLAP